jgi:hypothetical protein
MKIWKLNPIYLNHRDWEASRYRGEVIVRAESEERARECLPYSSSKTTWREDSKQSLEPSSIGFSH